MSKSRIMGAGLAGSSTVDVNVNGNQGGGSKKQGLPGYTNMRSSLVFSINQRAYGTPDSRNKVFNINQLSRVGPKSTMFAPTADGVNKTNESDLDGMSSSMYTQQQLQQLQNTLDYLVGSAIIGFEDLTNVYYDQMMSLSSSTQLNTELTIPSELDNYYLHNIDLTTFNSATTYDRLPMIVAILKLIIEMNSNLSGLSDANLKIVSDVLNSLPDMGWLSGNGNSEPLSLETVLSFSDIIKNNQSTLENYRTLIDDVIKLISYMQSHKPTLTSTSNESVKAAIIEQFIGLLQNTTESTSQTLGSSPPPPSVFTPGSKGDNANTTFQYALEYYFNNNDQDAIAALTTNGNNYDLTQIGNANGTTQEQELIGTWDTSNVTDMSNAFYDRTSFNQDISSWDMSNVTSMENMFGRAISFMFPVTFWNINSTTLTNLNYMFYGATQMYVLYGSNEYFNIDGNGTPSIDLFSTDKKYPTPFQPNHSIDFQNAIKYYFNNNDQDAIAALTTNGNNYDLTQIGNANGTTQEQELIGTWETGHVEDMSYAFQNRASFNQNINTKTITRGDGTTYDAWNVKNVTDMKYMFSGATSFNKPVNGWVVKNVTSMKYMFSGATSFNQNLPWHTVNLDNASHMFDGATSFNGNVQNWNMNQDQNNDENGNGDNNHQGGKIKNMSYMFYGATAFNRPISGWYTKEATDMSYMFAGATMFNKHLNFDTMNVVNMEGMFKGASDFNSGIGSFDVKKVTNMAYMFAGASRFNQAPITTWDVKNVTDMSYMFSQSGFKQDISGWDVKNVTDMSYMFSQSGFNQDISGWDVKKVSNMSYMFNQNIDFNADIRVWQINAINIIPTDDRSDALSNMFYGANAMENTYSSYTGYGSTPSVSFFGQQG